MSRKLPNKCWRTRAEVEGRAYRMLSFFHTHPSEIPEDQWTVLDHENSKILVDKVSLALMAECRCEMLSREADAGSKEPTIVAVQMDPLEETPKVIEEVVDEVIDEVVGEQMIDE